MTDDDRYDASVEGYMEYLRQHGGGLPEITNRDIALGILTPDYEAQMVAIDSFLQRNREAEEEASARIRELETDIKSHDRPDIVDYMVDCWVDHLHGFTYLDATHSMAAVGLLAPIIESLFGRAFHYFEQEAGKLHYLPPSDHERWRHRDQWNCRFVWKGGRPRPSIAKGIPQLAEAIGLTRHLPEDSGHNPVCPFLVSEQDVSLRPRMARRGAG